MRQIQVRSLTNQAVISDQCFVATRFFDRLKGLIGKKALSSGEAMLFPACNDIHMWFMSISIDVVFLSATPTKGSFVVSTTHSFVRPWKVLPLRDYKAHATLELPAGSIAKNGIARGDILCID